MAHESMWVSQDSSMYDFDLNEVLYGPPSPYSTGSSPQQSPLQSPEQSPLQSPQQSPQQSPIFDTTFDFYSLPPVQMQADPCGYSSYATSAEVFTTLQPVDGSSIRFEETQEFTPTYQRPRWCDVEVCRGSTDEYVVKLGGIEYPIDPKDTFDQHPVFQTQSLPVPATDTSYTSTQYCSPVTDTSYTSTQYCSPVTKRPACNTGTGRNRKLPRAERLWEFILRLLLDPNYNPSHIEWVDRDRGMFRLVNSRHIARLWGKRKNNYDMTYEKLSRAMRYYYHRKILQPVFGKKLVYKFGPNSTGWQLGPRQLPVTKENTYGA